MNKLILIMVVATLAYLGYDKYSEYTLQQDIEQQKVAALAQESQQFEAALKSQDVSTLNQFIQQHAESTFKDKAIFERDRLAYKLAIATDNPKQIINYISNYPTSQWADSAEQYLLKIKSQQAIDQKSQQLDLMRIQQQKEREIKKQANLETARDRVNRALSIYQNQRQKQETLEYQNKVAEQKRKQDEYKCNKIKDQLKHYKTNTRWYSLDEKGERVFIDKTEVEAMKAKQQKMYDDHCQ